MTTAAHAAEPAAIARFQILPAFAAHTPDHPAAEIALHDAQLVIAREHGFTSWRELREHVEERTLMFDTAVVEFVRCATGGAPDELTELDRFVASCARGDRAGAAALLAARPTLRGGLRPEHHLMLHSPAERGDAAVLETMRACGFKPGAADTDGVTPLHRAAMAGRVDATGVLLAHGAPVDALDGMFSATPLVWAAEGWSHGPRSGADHLEVARQLLAAGSPLDWTAPEAAPMPERVHELLIELRRAALASASLS